MSVGLASTAAPHVLELYETLRELDPVRFRREMAERLRTNLIRLSHELERLAEANRLPRGETAPATSVLAGVDGVAFASSLSVEHQEWELRERLYELAITLRELAERGEVTRKSWRELRARLHPAYESLARVLRLHAVHVPSLRPTNISRSVFHVGSGLVALLLVWSVPALVPWLASAFFLSALCMEVSRRFSPAANRVLMGLFRRVAHPHEAHRINSASWYAAALLVLAFSVQPVVSAVAVSVLAVADPLAALVGRRFGRVRLVHGRSLEGTVAFMVAGALTAFVVLSVLYPELALTPFASLRIAAGAAVCGGLAELFSKRLDDNLTVPLAAAFGAWAML